MFFSLEFKLFGKFEHCSLAYNNYTFGTRRSERRGPRETGSPTLGTMKTSVFLTKTQSRRFSQIFLMVYGTSTPSVTLLMRSLFLCSSGSKVCVEVEGPWRVLFQLEKTFKGLRPRLGSCWNRQLKEQNRKVFSG